MSVIIPTFNAQELVTHALDSVFTQTHRRIEIIIVDDASTDNTLQRAREKLRASPFPWRVLERNGNGGPSASRNDGLRASRGAWIQFLDADDLLAPGKLEFQIQVGEAAPSNVAAVHSTWLLGSVHQDTSHWQGTVCDPDFEGRHPVMCFLPRVRPLLAAALVRRTVLEEIGGLNESLRFWECEEVCYRIARNGRFERGSTNEPLYLWRLPIDKDYIGNESAKYASTEVGLAWIEQMLVATAGRPVRDLGLEPQDLRLVVDQCAQWARALHHADREAFASYMTKVRQLEPKFHPRRPLALALASRLLTYERAEALADAMRSHKGTFRQLLLRGAALVDGLAQPVA